MQAFDPRQEPHCTKANEQVSSVMNFLLQFYLEAVLFKSIEGLGISTKKKKNANIINIANEIIHKKKANDEKITEFLQKLVISDKERDLLEKKYP